MFSMYNILTVEFLTFSEVLHLLVGLTTQISPFGLVQIHAHESESIELVSVFEQSLRCERNVRTNRTDVTSYSRDVIDKKFASWKFAPARSPPTT